MRRVPQKWGNETNEMSDSNLSSITKTYLESWNMLRLTDNSRRRDLKAELFVGSQSEERAKLFSMNTYCLALNRRRKTNSIPGQSSPKISPFKYTGPEKKPLVSLKVGGQKETNHLNVTLRGCTGRRSLPWQGSGID